MNLSTNPLLRQAQYSTLWPTCRDSNQVITPSGAGSLALRAAIVRNRAPRRNLPSLPRTRVRLGSVPLLWLGISHPSPKQGAGAQPPPGLQRVPLSLTTSQGRAGGIAGLRAVSPLSSLPQAGCRGRSPRRRYRGSPPVSKNVGGWSGRDSGAGQAKLSAEGGRRPKQDPPLQPDTAPSQNKNNCAMVSHEVSPRPASLSRSLPHAYCTGG